MNKSRRAQLSRAFSMLNDVASTIEAVLDDERDALGNMPENLEDSERVQSMENAVDCLEEAIDNVQEATTNVQEAINC